MTTLNYKDYIYYSLEDLEKMKETNEYKMQLYKSGMLKMLENNGKLRRKNEELKKKILILEGYIKFMGGGNNG